MRGCCGGSPSHATAQHGRPRPTCSQDSSLLHPPSPPTLASLSTAFAAHLVAGHKELGGQAANGGGVALEFVPKVLGARVRQLHGRHTGRAKASGWEAAPRGGGERLRSALPAWCMAARLHAACQLLSRWPAPPTHTRTRTRPHLGKLLHARVLARHGGVGVAQVQRIQQAQQAGALVNVELAEVGVAQAGADAQHLWGRGGQAASRRGQVWASEATMRRNRTGFKWWRRPAPQPGRRRVSAPWSCTALPPHLVDEGAQLFPLQQRLDGGRQLGGGGGSARGEERHHQAGCKRGAHGCCDLSVPAGIGVAGKG